MEAHCFAKWFHTFYRPVVLEHHHLEEEIFFPFYKALGAELPPKPTADHAVLIKDLEDIGSKLNLIVDLLKVDPASAQASVLALQLTEQFEKWAAMATAHLEEEERVWPPIIEKYGEDRYLKCEALIVEEGVKNGGQVFETFTAAILNAMGYTFRGFPLLPSEKGWCGDIMHDQLLHQLPGPVRLLLLPNWNRRYHRLKGMVLSCAGEVDRFHVQSQQQFYKHGLSNCNCTIA